VSRGKRYRSNRDVQRAALQLVEKAMSPGGAAMFAGANRGAVPQGRSLVDAVRALTGQEPSSAGTFGMVPMPRNPLDNVPFGPLFPLTPDPFDPARRDTGRPEPRVSDYPVAWNLPGSGERLIPFRVLREAADGVDIMRRCIEIRKRHIRGLDSAWAVSEKAIQEAYRSDSTLGREDAESKLREQFLPEIKRMEEFWAHPWKSNGWSFGQWLNGVIEDHLVLDGVAIYPRSTYGGDVLDLEVVDATTIKPLLDYRGVRPSPPFPAFQQNLQGFPRGEFHATASGVDAEGNAMVDGGYLADQLFYGVENVRSFTPYGYSAVEQALISAKLYLARQGWMIAEYDDGVGPVLWLVPDGKGQGYGAQNNAIDGMNPRQRQEWEDSLNDLLRGNTKRRNRAKMSPPGMKPMAMPTVPEQYKSEYDLHLIKLLSGHFGVTMSELGFTESQGLGNSGLHDGQADVEQRVGQRPDEKMIAEMINELSHDFLRCPPEICFKFTSVEAEDTTEQDAVNKSRRERATITLNDERREIGKPPLAIPEADMPMILNAGAWVPLEGLAAAAQAKVEAEQALVDDQLANSEQQREVTEQTAAAEAEELSGQDAEKALEMAAYTRWRRKDRSRGRQFLCKLLEPTDWPGMAVPDDVDFDGWAWVAEEDIEKAAGGHDGWRRQARDGKGRWVKLGHMRADSLGPDRPGKAVLDGLARESASRRAAATRKSSGRRAGAGFAEPDPDDPRYQVQSTVNQREAARVRLAESAGITPESIEAERQRAADEARQRAEMERQAHEEWKRAMAAQLDPADIEAGRDRHLERLERHAEHFTGRPATEEDRAAVRAKWSDPLWQAVMVANDRADQRRISDRAVNVTGGSSAADKLRRAETMYGTDRSKWPAKAQQDAARLERETSSDRTRHVDNSSTTLGDMTKPQAKKHRVTLPDGTVAERNSSRPYTHVIAVERDNRMYAAHLHAEAEKMAANPGPFAAASARSLETDAKKLDLLPPTTHHVWGWSGSEKGAKSQLGAASLAPWNRSYVMAADGDGSDAGSSTGKADATAAAPAEVTAFKPVPARGERDKALQERAARAAIESLADQPGAWVSMRDLRAKLGGTRAEQDATIRAMALRFDGVNLVPEDNQKTLSDADHAAAIDLGAGPQHLIQIEPKRAEPIGETPAPDPTPVPAAATGRAKPTAHTAEWKGQQVSVNSSKPFTHAAVVRWGDGTETVHSFHESAAGAAKGNLAASQKRTGARVVGVVEVKREGDAAADAGTPTPAAAAPGAGVPKAQRFSVTRKGVKSAVVVTTDNAELARLADADAERRRRAGDTEGAARYEQSAAHFRGRPALEHKVHWSASANPDVRRHAAGDQSFQRAQVIAATPLGGSDAPGETPAPDPTPIPAAETGKADHPQKAAYDKLLDGGMVKHKNARQIIEQMEAHGWTIASPDPRYQVTQFEASDGRKMTAQHLMDDKPKFYPGGGVTGGNPSYKAALAHVVTPTHAEVGGPNVRTAAEQVSPELGARVRNALSSGGTDDHVRRLDRAQRELVGYGSTPKRPAADIVADLRSQADRLDATAQSNAEHHASMGNAEFGESPVAVRQRREAGELRAIADVMDRQATERQAYEAEVARRATLPLDIRPTTRGKQSAPKPAAPAAPTPDAPTPDAPATPRAIPRREPGQVKRGDLMVVERIDSPTESMRREGHTERKTYEIFRVTSATRDGQAARVARLDWHGMDHAGNPVKNVFLRSHGKRNVIPGDQIDVAAVRESLLARRYEGHPGQAKPHDDLRELTGMLRSHLRDEPAQKPAAR
jgi:hypothetical protein